MPVESQLLKRSQENTVSMLRTPRLDYADANKQRKLLRAYFINTFDEYTRLFDALSCDEAFYKKPISLRHPLIFYFGHTATFFVNKMLLARLLDKRLDERLESIFAVGVDEMSWDDLDEANYSWPSVEEVREYRAKLRATVLDVIDHAPLNTPIHWQHPWWSIIMGVEHERIHLETSSVLIRQHDLSYVKPLQGWEICPLRGDAPENQLIALDDASITIGKERQSSIYGWDNEYGQHQADVKGFQAAKFLVSNQEYLAFVEAGAYKEPEFWTEEGQNWLSFAQREQPEFWRKKGDEWYLRTMTEEIPMPWNWPVEVNYLEAKAFCNWKAAQTGLPIRLPTEDEWHVIHQASGLPANDPEGEAWNANVQLEHWASSCPVDTFKQGDFYDVVGNVWQWSETPIYPFDGFEVHPHYDDFTMPTFDNKHNLILGASWVSCGNEVQLASRYAFRRHFFQHAGFRYIASDVEVTMPTAHYETDEEMCLSAEFNYGNNYLGTENYAKTLLERVMPYVQNKGKALDLGCATGRASFELARNFEQVTGVDFSARLINIGVQLNDQGVVRYALADEGELQLFKTRRLSDLGLDKLVNKPEFLQGDACNLKPVLSGYDFVLAANLIENLYEPKRFLQDIPQRINAGGILVIASNYQWQEEKTPKSAWLGGIKKDGESYTTFNALQEQLSEHFDLVAEPFDVPSVQRITSRDFNYQQNQVTVWRKHEQKLKSV